MGKARLVGIVLLLAGAGHAQARQGALVENPLVNDCYRLLVTMQLKGEIVVLQEEKPSSLKLAATAEHRYRERVLAVPAQGGLIAKVARLYDDARGSITVDGSTTNRTLRPERRLVVAQRQNETLSCYSPHGALTREEMEMVSEHFDTMCVAGLLPGKELKLGETWKVSNAAAQAVCSFEGLVANELTGKFTGVENGVAIFGIDGTAKGIELGAQSSVTVSATGRYDLTKKRLVALEWKQRDARDQGPASPASNVETTVTLTREPIAEPKELSDVALVSVPPGFDVPPAFSNLVIRDVKGRFELAAARDWQVVSQTESHLVLRLLERGDFVAQATITPWQKVEPGQHMEVKDFHEAMMTAPGWEAQEVIQEGEVPNQRPGRFVFRMSVRGQMGDVKVVQSFFLVAGPKGDQCVVAVTLKQAQLSKLNVRDMILVEGLEVLSK